MIDKLAKVRGKFKVITTCLTSEAQRIYSSNLGMAEMNDALTDEENKRIDQILNTPIPIEGGVCLTCKGTGDSRVEYNTNRKYPDIVRWPCHLCKGTGKLTKTIKELIEEA